MRYLLILLIATSALWASEVMKVGKSQMHFSVSQDLGKPWNIADPACVVRDGKTIACGQIVFSNQSQAVLKIDEVSNEIGRGDRVIAKKEWEKKRQPTALMNSLETDATSSANFRFHALTAGVSVGDGFYFPLLHFQRILDSNFAVGLMPTYLSNSTSAGTSLTALGALGSLNYYSEGFFRGFWAQLAAGPYFFSANTSTAQQSSTSLSALGTVGWRGNWELGANVGLALGFQYLPEPQITGIQLGLSEFRVLVLFDVGLTF